MKHLSYKRVIKPEVDKKPKEKTDRDTTGTVVERPMAAKWKRTAAKKRELENAIYETKLQIESLEENDNPAEYEELREAKEYLENLQEMFMKSGSVKWKRTAAKRRELEGPEDEYYYESIGPFYEKVIEYIAKRDLKGLANQYMRYAPKDFEGNFASEFEWLSEAIESDYADPRLLTQKSEYEWNLKDDVWDFFEEAEGKLINAWSNRELKKVRKDPDYKFFATLGELFTVGPVSPSEMKYVNYKPYKNYIRLNDSDGQLGNMHADTGHSSLLSFMKQNGIKNPTVEMFIDFLKRRGANLLKKRKPRKHYPPLYD